MFLPISTLLSSACSLIVLRNIFQGTIQENFFFNLEVLQVGKMYFVILFFLSSLVKLSIIYTILKPFRSTDLFLYPLKTSENFLFMFSGSIEKDQWHETV